MKLIELILGFGLLILRIFVIFKVFYWLFTSGQNNSNISEIQNFLVFMIADYYVSNIYNLNLNEKD